MKIALIVAIPEEITELLDRIGEPVSADTSASMTVLHYRLYGNDVYVTGSGAGEIAAAASTQHLISRYGAELIINFGVVGGLTEDMGLRSTVIVERAVHYQYDASAFYKELKPAQYPGYDDIYVMADPSYLKLACSIAPELEPVTLASADVFVNDTAAKRALNTAYGAQVCDMEGAGILLTCDRNKVPALMIKAVSDSVHGGAEEFAAMVSQAAAICVNILLKILEQL